MKRPYAHFILLLLFFAFTTAESGFALNPDFYRQKKIKKDLKRQRERGAASLAGERKKRIAKKKKEAEGFSKVRRRQERAKIKRDKLLVQDSKDKAKFKSRKINQALKSVKKKRKKLKVGWREQSLEYDIPLPEVKEAKAN